MNKVFMSSAAKGFLSGFLLFLVGCTGLALLMSNDDLKSDEKRYIDKDKIEYPSWVIPEPEYLKEPKEECSCGSSKSNKVI